MIVQSTLHPLVLPKATKPTVFTTVDVKSPVKDILSQITIVPPHCIVLTCEAWRGPKDEDQVCLARESPSVHKKINQE